MVPSNLARYCLPFLFIYAVLTNADESYQVEHIDPIYIEKSLSLQTVIDLTLEKYPDRLINQAMQEQAKALRLRGDSWVAGASNLSVAYLNDIVANDIGFQQTTAQVLIPVWNWNQRSAGQQLADQAQNVADKHSTSLKLQVAGLVRIALWNLALENIRYQQMKSVLDISEKLLQKIKQRVDLGDLPRSDYLLAQSDFLQKRSLLTQAEAKVMHARKNYISLTGLDRIPENFSEQISRIDSITENHPALQIINARIKKNLAQVNWIKSKGSGQPMLQLGMQSEKGSSSESSIESAGVGFSIPFGGQAFRAPQIAQAVMQLNQAKTEREHLYRQLEKNLHEAKHALQVNAAELAIANKLKNIAKKHLKMTELSFSTGEINLLDLLRIQAQTFNAIRHAKEREIQQQQIIAIYNQAVGVLP